MLTLLEALQTPPTPFSQEAFTQLIAQLETLKDENAKEDSSRMGKTLSWNEKTGKVFLTVRNFPYLSVNVSVMTTPLWKEYMDSRELNSIENQFYFNEHEDAYEFHVNTPLDLICAIKEMRFLNWLRLNWLQQKTDRRTVLAMGAHPRLGVDSPLALLDAGILEAIAKQL
jgi:hypothetical protein